jgi:hypothetical protein
MKKEQTQTGHKGSVNSPGEGLGVQHHDVKLILLGSCLPKSRVSPEDRAELTSPARFSAFRPCPADPLCLWVGGCGNHMIQGRGLSLGLSDLPDSQDADPGQSQA